MIKLRNDPEAIEDYRDILLETLGVDTSDLSDEEVHAKMEQLLNDIVRAFSRVAQHMARAFKSMQPSLIAIGKAMENLQFQEEGMDEPS